MESIEYHRAVGSKKVVVAFKITEGERANRSSEQAEDLITFNVSSPFHAEW